MSSTYEKLNRLKIRLSQGPATIQELCTSTGCNIRSVYRHLEALEADNCGLRKTQSGRIRRYYLEQNTPSVPDSLVQGLQKMQKELASGGNHRHAKIIPTVLSYLQSEKPKDTVPEAISLDPFFELDHGPLSEYSPSSTKVEKLLSAIHTGKVLWITYGHRDGTTEKIEFQPWHVVLRVGRLYLLGCRSGQSEVESLVVSRIQLMVASGSFFMRPDFDVREHYKFCFGQWVPRQKGVRPLNIVLAPRDSWGQILFSESNFNPPAKIRNTRDGVRIELKLYNTPDLRKWLISLLPEVQVLEPQELRQALKKQIEDMRQSL